METKYIDKQNQTLIYLISMTLIKEINYGEHFSCIQTFVHFMYFFYLVYLLLALYLHSLMFYKLTVECRIYFNLITSA